MIHSRNGLPRLLGKTITDAFWDADAEPAKGYISVLSPAGMALIGLPVGAIGRWVGPGGEESVAQIERILFQPEATGDYVT